MFAVSIFGVEILEAGELSSFGLVAIAFGLLSWMLILGTLRRLATTSHFALAAGSTVSTAAILVGLTLLLVA